MILRLELCWNCWVVLFVCGSFRFGTLGLGLLRRSRESADHNYGSLFVHLRFPSVYQPHVPLLVPAAQHLGITKILVRNGAKLWVGALHGRVGNVPKISHPRVT